MNRKLNITPLHVDTGALADALLADEVDHVSVYEALDGVLDREAYLTLGAQLELCPLHHHDLGICIEDGVHGVEVYGDAYDAADRQAEALLVTARHNASHAIARCDDPDCGIHNPEVIEDDRERLNACAWYYAGAYYSTQAHRDEVQTVIEQAQR